MKLRRLFPLFLVGFFGCAVPDEGTGADTQQGAVQEDGSGQRIKATATQIVVHYNTGWGHRISIRGNGAGLDWTHGKDATWTTGDAWVLSVTTSTAIELKPLFDDATWSKGPNWKLTPGQTLDIWPHFFHDAGRLEMLSNWYSHVLNNSRTVTVYLPPSYDENGAERYPVVYMHDGQNLFVDSQSFGGVSWNVTGALDKGAADATIGETIVVGIDNDAGRIWEYTPTDGGYGGGGADTYLTFIADELRPEINKQYRTVTDRAHTAILGSSLGGLVSVYAGTTRPEVFGLIGALSPSTWWDNIWIIPHVQTETTNPVRVYVDSGDSGPSNDDKTNTAKLAQTYKSNGATVDYLVQAGGQHSEVYWRQRLPGALSFLVGTR
jgi:predicted alpha/beta superfamily hydrolase